MLSLKQITAQSILKTLPQECIEELITTYYDRDREYDLKTFVEVDTPPDKCWFFTFHHGWFVAASAYHPTNPGYTTDKKNVKIYCLPRSKFNEIFYTKDNLLTPTSIIEVSLKTKCLKYLYWTTEELLHYDNCNDYYKGSCRLKGRYFAPL